MNNTITAGWVGDSADVLAGRAESYHHGTRRWCGDDECQLNIGKVWGGHGPRGYSWGLGVIQDLT